MISIKEILVNELDTNTNREFDEIAECVDETTGFFVGSRYAEKLVKRLDECQCVNTLKKVFGDLKAYEDKVMNEEFMSKTNARILIYSVEKELKECYDEMVKMKGLSHNDSIKLTKAYASALFEFNTLCREYEIIPEEFVYDSNLYESISDEMAKIASEIL